MSAFDRLRHPEIFVFKVIAKIFSVVELVETTVMCLRQAQAPRRAQAPRQAQAPRPLGISVGL